MQVQGGVQNVVCCVGGPRARQVNRGTNDTRAMPQLLAACVQQHAAKCLEGHGHGAGLQGGMHGIPQ